MRKVLLALGMIFLGISGLKAADSNPQWLRYPSISPDGQTIVFCYKGDIFSVPSNGGEARPLTINPAYDFHPVWAPDGKTIVFASNRYGNFDLFKVPARGGKPARLTYHSSNEVPYSFTPDGKEIYFGAHIMDNVNNVQFPSSILAELYKVPVKGGRISQVLTTPAEDVQSSTDGKFLLFHDRKGYEDTWRKHHTSSVTRDLWMYDFANKSYLKLSDFNGENRTPVLGVDNETYYYLSEKSGSFNIWKTKVKAKEAQPVTDFKKHPVRFLSASKDEKLCFTFNGDIYTLSKGGKSQKVAIDLVTDDISNEEKYQVLSSGATDMDVSPDGKEVAFIVRGEVYVTSVEYATTKRITNTAEQERSVSFSPNGRSLLYASERNNSWNLYQTKIVREEDKNFVYAPLLKEEPVLESKAETFQPAWSPDGKEVAFLEERNTLRVINVKSKKARTILPAKYNYSYSDGDQWYQWSPDGKWFLVKFIANGRWMSEVGLVSAKGGEEVINLTKSGYGDEQPKWVMKGAGMIWATDRMGLRSHGSWGSQNDVYAMFFTQKAFDKFRLSKEEYELVKAKENGKKKDKEKKEGEDKKDKKEKKKEEKAEKKDLKIELEGLEDRALRLTINSSDLADAVLTPDGEKLYYLSHFEKGYDLWMKNIRKNETKLVVKLGGQAGELQIDKDGKNLFLLAGGKLMKITISGNKQKGIAFRGEFNWKPSQERSYIFEHAWRQVLKKFYDPEIHGLDWEGFKKNYAQFLPHINNNYDFAEMMSEMLGELNASHTGCRYYHRVSGGDQTAALGAFFDPDFKGQGLLIKEVIEKGPLVKADANIKAGVIIEKIDGRPIAPNLDYFQMLNHKAGKQVLLSLKDSKKNKKWDVMVKPVSQGSLSNLLYERWVKQRREECEKVSNGKIGYVHVKGMNSSSFRKTFSDVLGRHMDKDAIVVDTRFNGGGWLHDDLATLLSGKRYVDFAPRGQYIGSEPLNKWYKPSAVIMGEGNYSDAHGFPYTYKALGVGKLVGMPVPGTMTAVWWERQIDPTIVFGIPQMGVKDLDGKYLENQQLEPDVKVMQKPEVVSKGKDEQLRKAVEVLLQ